MQSTPKLNVNPKIQATRVLLVEENPAEREALRTHFTNFGFSQVQEAETGQMATFKIKNASDVGKHFHLIVLEWVMSGSDGLNLLKQIRADEKLSQTKVIMLTSISDPQKVKEAIQAGVDDFVVKPLDPTLMKDKLEKLTEKIHAPKDKKIKKAA